MIFLQNNQDGNTRMSIGFFLLSQIWFTNLPVVLTFELSRFGFNQQLNRAEKIHQQLSFPPVIYVDRWGKLLLSLSLPPTLSLSLLSLSPSLLFHLYLSDAISFSLRVSLTLSVCLSLPPFSTPVLSCSVSLLLP